MKSRLREASDDPRIQHHPHIGKVDLARLKAVLEEQSGPGGESIDKATEAYLRFLKRRDQPN